MVSLDFGATPSLCPAFGLRLVRGVKNLRYTQNALEALINVEAVGDRTEISTELFFGGSRAPAVKMRDFKFSSSTTH